MLLHSKEGRITMIGTRLQEAQPGYDRRQNITAINWRSNRQAQGSRILQQIGSNLGIQQRLDQRRKQMESCIPD